MKNILFLLISLFPGIALLAQPDTLQIGKASYYADAGEGRITASGDVFSQQGLTAAHPALPFNTLVEVTNLINNQSVELRINDRMPYQDERVLKVSQRAAEKLGMLEMGVVYVKIQTLGGVKIPKIPADSLQVTKQGEMPPGMFTTMALPENPTAGFGIQVGAYTDISNLHQTLKLLRFGWGKEALVFLDISGKRTRFRVILGPFDTRYQAEAYQKNMQVLLGTKKLKGFVVSLKKLDEQNEKN